MLHPKMYNLQKAFLKTQMKKYPRSKKLQHLVFCTHLAHEVHEVMDCKAWKFQRAQEEKPRSELIEELVDVFKLWMNLLITNKVTETEFETAFLIKSARVMSKVGMDPREINEVLKGYHFQRGEMRCQKTTKRRS